MAMFPRCNFLPYRQDMIASGGSCLPDTPGRYAGMPSPPAELRAIAPTPLRAPQPTVDICSVGVNTSPLATSSPPPLSIPSPSSSAKVSSTVG